MSDRISSKAACNILPAFFEPVFTVEQYWRVEKTGVEHASRAINETGSSSLMAKGRSSAVSLWMERRGV